MVLFRAKSQKKNHSNYKRSISYSLEDTVFQKQILFSFFLFQKYRHVDNIMFENHTIADRFLDFWRKTGSQRMGYLYGRYTEHKDIPLGIRAEVAAIYEPPQVLHQSLQHFSIFVFKLVRITNFEVCLVIVHIRVKYASSQ